MPRPKSTPQSKRTAAAKRSRRSPYELLQELREKREQLRASMEARIAKLDARIELLETRHEHKIKVSELLAKHSPAELAKDLEALRAQQSLLRRALKQGS